MRSELTKDFEETIYREADPTNQHRAQIILKMEYRSRLESAIFKKANA
jgi:hypothetical protein